jgi:hypothetical protein
VPDPSMISFMAIDFWSPRSGLLYLVGAG